MANEVSAFEANGLPPVMPSINSDHPLAFEVFALTDEMFQERIQQSTYSPAIRQAAREALVKLEPFERPVSEQILREWVAPIPLVVRNEKTPEALAGWFSGLLLAVDGMPCGAFTLRNQRDALQTFKFFPSVSDICDILSPTSARIRQQMQALRLIAKETP